MVYTDAAGRRFASESLATGERFLLLICSRVTTSGCIHFAQDELASLLGIDDSGVRRHITRYKKARLLNESSSVRVLHVNSAVIHRGGLGPPSCSNCGSGMPLNPRAPLFAASGDAAEGR
jgi:hypothetical protein